MHSCGMFMQFSRTTESRTFFLLNLIVSVKYNCEYCFNILLKGKSVMQIVSLDLKLFFVVVLFVCLTYRYPR